MILTHRTTESKAEQIKKEGFIVTKGKNTLKPSGVWISVNKGWENWCSNNDFNTNEHQIEITLSISLVEDLKIFKIDTYADLYVEFHKYCSAYQLNPKKEIKYPSFNHSPSFWEWLYVRYDGIYLTAHGEQKTRFGTFMYGFDCECMVIFNPKNVMVIE